MRVEEFDFELPEELIAKRPVYPRDSCKLMVISRKDGSIKHAVFRDILELLDERDLIVFNDTRVIPARLFAKKPSGGKVEVLLTDFISERVWHALIGGRGIKEGISLRVAQDFDILVRKQIEGPKFEVEIVSKLGDMEAIELYGKLPLPPYIQREEEPSDREDYQSVFARNPGSVAAPTASLHFTESLIEALRQKGVKMAFLTLHISYGTFKPVKTENVKDHKVDEEFVIVPKQTAELIRQTKALGGRIVAVGTTVVRALETAGFESFFGKTGLYIYPGYEFKVVDVLITNFHLPRSSLLFLVSAFAGKELIMKAYNLAIKERYRFYSFGDAMIIL
ncbi:MAG: tRNA preQ1(34) S-adenosylmethionine ribosyltransferase-isomerase QueA [Aquificaceae bacterium]|nr:tRNA preQ1(34) S-adenosylmethionine ribosyltransferase-isomerase QueA [Aquificaceae bacterium]MDW8236865.1 tRNA preQ1(34) S-adenosylmethionine ribosyltransferase-isomerase QueA [Aquificaceae bacterium]